MLKLYENIRRHRKEAGMTQDELARLTGYTDRSSIAKIEKGLVDLTQTKIAQFAQVFGVSAGELMGWEQEPEGTADIVAQVLLNPGTLAMVEDFLQLPESDQYAVRLMVASLREKQKKTDASVSRMVEFGAEENIKQAGEIISLSETE